MKRTRVSLLALSLLLILVLSLSLVPMVSAQTNIQVTTGNNVRLRGGPGTEFPQVGSVPMNTTLPAVGRNETTSWIQVNYNGTLGWVASQFLTWSGDINSLPVGGVSAPPPPAPTGGQPSPVAPAAPGGVTGTPSNTINVRSAPSATASPLGQLAANTTVPLLGRWGAGSSAWMLFDFQGQQGWVAGWLLRISGDVNTLPDLQAQQAAAEAAVRQICATGAGVPQAAAYAGGPGIHPVLMIDTSTGAPHAWSSTIPAWKPGTALATQLVACVEPQHEEKIEHCYYDGPDIERFQWFMPVRLVAAQTGQVVASTTLAGTPPRACQMWEDWDLVRLDGMRITPNQLTDWLRPYVQP